MEAGFETYFVSRARIDGGIYTGRLVEIEDVPHAFGIFENQRDGSVYRGGFFNGKRHGIGRIDFPEKHFRGISVYAGFWEFDEMAGEAIIEYADGSQYRGRVTNGVPHGKGRKVSVEGSYEGDWLSGQRSGYGLLKKGNGDYYLGQWKHDKCHGYGIYQFSNRDRYEGQFRNGEFHGKGVYYYVSGSVYIGHFKDSKKSGIGIMMDNDSNILHGIFEDDSRCTGLKHKLSINESDISKWSIEKNGCISHHPLDETESGDNETSLSQCISLLTRKNQGRTVDTDLFSSLELTSKRFMLIEEFLSKDDDDFLELVRGEEEKAIGIEFSNDEEDEESEDEDDNSEMADFIVSESNESVENNLEYSSEEETRILKEEAKEIIYSQPALRKKRKLEVSSDENYDDAPLCISSDSRRPKSRKHLSLSPDLSVEKNKSRKNSKNSNFHPLRIDNPRKNIILSDDEVSSESAEDVQKSLVELRNDANAYNYKNHASKDD